jgi:hypothetical protein
MVAPVPHLAIGQGSSAQVSFAGAPTRPKHQKKQYLFLPYQSLAAKLTMMQQHLGSLGHCRVRVQAFDVMRWSMRWDLVVN